MTRILFLDDDPRRAEAFRAAVGHVQCELVMVETAEECIVSLQGASFDLVLLDHDLGGEIYCDSSREDCGMEVVRWLKANGGAHGAFIVHTMNPMAAATMFLELQAMGRRVAQAPFGSSRFYGALREFLGIRPREPRKQPPSLRERWRQYLRSIRFRN